MLLKSKSVCENSRDIGAFDFKKLWLNVLVINFFWVLFALAKTVSRIYPILHLKCLPIPLRGIGKHGPIDSDPGNFNLFVWSGIICDVTRALRYYKMTVMSKV